MSKFVFLLSRPVTPQLQLSFYTDRPKPYALRILAVKYVVYSTRRNLDNIKSRFTWSEDSSEA